MRLVQLQFCLATLGRWIDTALVVICGLLLCVMGSSVFYEVLIRYVFKAPTPWTEELAQFLLVWYGLLAAGVGARKGLHFAIRWGVMHLDDRTRWIIRQVVNIGVVVLLCVILYQAIKYLHIVANQTSMGLEVNMRFPYAGIPFGIGVILTMYVLEVCDGLLSLWTGQQFSIKEAREEEIHLALKSSDAELAPAPKPAD